MFEGVRQAYRSRVLDVQIEGRFLATLAYLAGFLVTRGWTAWGYFRGDRSHIAVGETHVHHMVPGLGLVLGAGVVGLDVAGPERDDLRRRVSAVMFGAGAALVVDEFCLIWHVEDTYWQERGVNVSLLGVLAVGGMLAANLFIGRQFYRAVEQRAVGAVSQSS
jgi:hypothetical protein